MRPDKKLPVKVKRRLKLFEMFYPLNQNEKRKWGRLFASSSGKIRETLADKAVEMGYEQKVLNNNTIAWRDKSNSEPECMFCFVHDSADFKSVKSIFVRIEKYKPFITYAVIRQIKDGENVFDIFRFSKFSYMEHCNRVKY